MPKFAVTYSISGSMTEIIEAADKDAAEKIIEAKFSDPTWEPEPDEAEVDHYHVQEMHRVQRDGKVMSTTYLLDGDVVFHD